MSQYSYFSVQLFPIEILDDLVTKLQKTVDYLTDYKDQPGVDAQLKIAEGNLRSVKDARHLAPKREWIVRLDKYAEATGQDLGKLRKQARKGKTPNARKIGKLWFVTNPLDGARA
jgi:hypothetical protein